LIDGSSTVNQAILTAKVNYSMDMVSEITMEVLDHANELASSNYFSIGRKVWYRGYTSRDLTWVSQNSGFVEGERIWQLFEIASVTMGPGPAVNPVWNLKLRPSACQQMKRDKDPATVAGNGHNLIINAAHKYGLECMAQETEDFVKWTAKGEDEVKESLWDIMKKTASMDRSKSEHAQFRLFEADGILFFGTQRWLLGRWGTTYDNPELGLIDPEGLIAGGGNDAYNYVELNWPPRRSGGGIPDPFQLMALPTCSRSDNNPIATEGSVQIDRFNGRSLRPGMTIFLSFDDFDRGDKRHYFQGMYLISSVSFEHIGNAPVSINFRSPERLAKDIKMLEVGAHGGKQFLGSYAEI
jgi:hypothetical protein